MSNFSMLICLLALLSLLSLLSAAASPPSQNPLPFTRRSGNKNVTLTFDDLPTHNGFGTISTYQNFEFSSFRLVNITAAASAGHISPNDTGCATSSHNALIGQKSKTPSLWPRIALSPLAHILPGEAPFFKLHGLSMKPMNQTDAFMCISILAYGLDEERNVRSYDGFSACFAPRFRGGHVNITDYFPTWGQAVNVFEIYAVAVEEQGEEVEFVDWPFCVDDIVLERVGSEWEWPEPWWPKIIPLLPPLAPFKFDDQRKKDRRYSLFSEDGRAGFDRWRAGGAEGMFLHWDRSFGG